MSHSERGSNRLRLYAIIALVALGVALTQRGWLPSSVRWAKQLIGANATEPRSEDHAHDHADPFHSSNPFDRRQHPQHEDATAIQLSVQAMKNVGLSLDNIRPIQLETFTKSVIIPGQVAERPGRSRMEVSTPLTGVITHVHTVAGEAVEPGTLLFQIRLTHEDLVKAQTDFVRMLGELDVEENEIRRLENVAQSGAVAGKVLLERQYAKRKLEAQIEAQRESLRLHGLSADQVDQISEHRKLLRELQILAPRRDDHSSEEYQLAGHRKTSFRSDVADPVSDDVSHPLILQTLSVHKGQSVNAGETLCVLADYDELFIEGLAFEQDIRAIRTASKNDWSVEAVLEQGEKNRRVLSDLQIAYLDNQIDSQTRTLRFFVRLPNELLLDRRVDGSRYVQWKYVPGQRLRLRVPVEQWTDQIVLPIDAIARDGAEYFVFEQHGQHFDRVPVHVRYRDPFSVVITSDEAIRPGDLVAMTGAHQMQMALRNRQAAPPDPHAGHNH